MWSLRVSRRPRFSTLFCLVSLATVPAAAPALAQTCQRWIDMPMSPPSTGADGPIYASVVCDIDGAGYQPPMLVVGGDFTSIDGVSANHVAAWDGFAWHPLGAGTDSLVTTLAVFDGQLVAGGTFLHAGGLAANRVALWNGAVWLPLGSGCGAAFPDEVYALKEYAGQLYAGGYFQTPASNIAVWNGSAWAALAGGCDRQVLSLEVYDNDLYAGGSFYLVDGSPTTLGLAYWDGSAWHACNSPASKNALVEPLNGARLMCAFNGLLYDAGYGGVGVWDGSTYDVSLWPFVQATALGLAVCGGRLYAGGDFIDEDDDGDGTPTPLLRVAELTASDWVQVGEGLGPPYSGYTGHNPNIFVATLADYNDRLYAGGQFQQTGSGELTNNIAFYSGSGWHCPATPANVSALATYGSTVAIGGDFSQPTPGGQANFLVRWNGQQLSPLGIGPDAPVRALLAYTDASFPNDKHVIVGGSFTHAGGVAANHLARWTESIVYPFDSWSTMGAGFNGDVQALGTYRGQYVAGGSFSQSGGNATSHVARWDGSAWQAIGTGMNGTVRALDAYTVPRHTFTAYILVAAGDFSLADGASANRIASWGETNLGGAGPWLAMGDGFNATVRALANFQNDEYAAGDFTLSGATAVNHIARWDGTAWVPVGATQGGGTDGPVYALWTDGTDLYAAGDFGIADGNYCYNLARWDGATWSAVAGGTNGMVEALAPYHGELIAGGQFWQAGLVESWSVARYLETGVPWLQQQPLSQTKDVGATANFSVAPASGYDGLAYAWRRDAQPLADGLTPQGSLLSGTATAALTIENVALADSGSYDCVVSNECGSVTSISVPLIVTSPTGVDSPASGPLALALQVRDNPARGVVRLLYTLPDTDPARLEIFDLEGRRVSVPPIEARSSGTHELAWTGEETRGHRAPAGVYFARISTRGREVTRRFVWLP